MKKTLFIYRDGAILQEPYANQADVPDRLTFVPGVISALASVSHELEYDLVMVTEHNEPATGSYHDEASMSAHDKMLSIMKGEGILFSGVISGKALSPVNADRFKTVTGFVPYFMRGMYDLNNSFVIGDSFTGIELADTLGCRAIWFNRGENGRAVLSTTNWNAVYRFLKARPRTAQRIRKTNETEIDIYVNLDGEGKGEAHTGLGFFDHMLDQVSKHSGFDIIINAKGDLRTDEHHTIEDVGITLGEAVNEALGQRKGISRYGFLLPMDDSLAQVAIDFGGRPWLVWQVVFRREMIGDMPAEMFSHFFKSFTDGAKCNLNIKADGENEHHKAEALFKALGKVLQMAVRKDYPGSVPSTKGIL